MKKKLCALLLAGITLLTGCELDQKDLDRANSALDAAGKGVDWIVDGVNGIINGEPAKPGASIEEIMTGGNE